MHSAGPLSEFCRSLRHTLSAGLSLSQAMRLQAQRGPATLRPLAANLAEALEHGEDLESALAPHARQLPPLFLALVSVGERTGHLPEIFEALQGYFTLQLRLRRQFLSQIAWPVFQLGMGIGVLTLLILVLGLLGSKFDPLGLGLSGPRGAVIFLAGVAGLAALAWGLFWLSRRSLRQGKLDGLLLRLPVLGPCLEALAMHRFCLAGSLTLETALPIDEALALSLQATSNDAFLACRPRVTAALKQGEELAETLAQSGVFPETFLAILANAEQAGRIPEVLREEAQRYANEASRRLKVLTAAAGWLVWGLIAVLIAVVIFRIFLAYLKVLHSLV